MNFAFAFEPLDKVRADGVEDILLRHWEEVALNKDQVPLAIDWTQYYALERAGILKSVVMRQGGRLIGYDAFFVQPTLHYRTSLWALNDILYLVPEHRRGRAGVLLIDAAEHLLRDLGVQKVLYHTKLHLDLGHHTGGDTVGRLLSKRRYVHVENVWAKML